MAVFPLLNMSYLLACHQDPVNVIGKKEKALQENANLTRKSATLGQSPFDNVMKW
jgi:hypothetical protein